MESVKKHILRAILPFERASFTQQDIIIATELPQQTVSYHLNNLTKNAYLIKDGGRKGRYRIANQSEFTFLVLDEKDRVSYREPQFKLFSEEIGNWAEITRACRVLSIRGSDVMNQAMLENLNTIIEEARQFKRWFGNSNPTKKDAAEFLLSGESDSIQWIWENSQILQGHYSNIEWNDKMLWIKEQYITKGVLR